MGGIKKSDFDDKLKSGSSAVDAEKARVRSIQEKLNKVGYKLTVDGELGPITDAAIKDFQKNHGLAVDGEVGPRTSAVLDAEISQYKSPKPEEKEEPKPVPVLPLGNPAYLEAKKYAGKKETDPKFNAWLSGFWGKLGLPNYKTIIGTSFAWCALFIAAMNSEVGQKYITQGGASAKRQGQIGVAVDWKKNGIPRGAVIYLDHEANCDGKGSHITFADGSCSPQDVAKKDATFPGFGGNQGNTVKTSFYPVKDICTVRWPHEVALPPAVKVSEGCAGKAAKESTR